VRRIISTEFREALNEVSAFVWPTTPTPAFPIGQYSSDPTAMYLEDIFTVPVNLVGMPALSIPINLAQNRMPMGMTIAGPLLGDSEILKIGKAIESHKPY
jgi:aspartyl-tRNA(Asn)/glutamyl-tRNA(Gln) amidotransferase subunit A